MAQDNTKTSPRRIRAKVRQARALELRKSGNTYQLIADALGFKSVQAAHKSVKTALERMVNEPAEELRELELARLDGMLNAIWLKVRNGDVAAIDRALKIMDRRARYLGLDAPTEIKIDDWRESARRDGINADELHERLVAEFAAAMVASSDS